MINYKFLKKEEQELINQFKNFLNDVLHWYENCFNVFIKKDINDEIFDDALYQDKKNNEIAHDILDDCIWFIQKNEPRANHLRLIIAIINSLNDIKRISNYVVNMAKYHQKNILEIDNQIIKVINKIGELTIETSKKIINLIQEFDLGNLKKNVNNIFDKYIEKYKTLFYESIQLTINSQNNAKIIANSVVLMKNFDRTIDHLINITDNLISII